MNCKNFSSEVGLSIAIFFVYKYQGLSLAAAYRQEVEPPSPYHASQRRQEFPAEGPEEVEVCRSDFEEVSEPSPQRKKPAKRPSAASIKKEDTVTLTIERPVHRAGPSGQGKSYRSASMSPSIVTEV